MNFNASIYSHLHAFVQAFDLSSFAKKETETIYSELKTSPDSLPIERVRSDIKTTYFYLAYSDVEENIRPLRSLMKKDLKDLSNLLKEQKELFQRYPLFLEDRSYSEQEKTSFLGTLAAIERKKSLLIDDYVALTSQLEEAWIVHDTIADFFREPLRGIQALEQQEQEMRKNLEFHKHELDLTKERIGQPSLFPEENAELKRTMSHEEELCQDILEEIATSRELFLQNTFPPLESSDTSGEEDPLGPFSEKGETLFPTPTLSTEFPDEEPFSEHSAA